MTSRPFQPADFKRKSAAVLGLGRSGLHAANLLARHGFKVLVSDSRPRSELRSLAAKLHPRVRWEAGGHSNRLLACGFAVKSPGIPSHAEVLGRLRKAGMPIFSELEIALALCKSSEVIAITGTNGKTTTTLLTVAVFKTARRGVHAVGNIGIPLAAVVSKVRKSDALVLEVSSYQLEDSLHFHPRAAALLNITADHVDHHGGMSRYIAAKTKIFRDQTPHDACVFNAADPIAVKLSRQCPARRLFFSVERTPMSHAWVHAGRIHISPTLSRSGGRNGKAQKAGRKDIQLIPPRLPGNHNLENAMAAALLALDCGIPPSAVQKAFRSFKGVEHRLEDCGVVSGIRCINDSKATNVESTLTALKAVGQNGKGPNTLLILGGLHKGYPYTPLKPFLGRSVKGILTIGSAARKIEEDLSGDAPIFPCNTLEEAVKTGFKIGQAGDILLLSPACASFDQFKDFEDRGAQFKELVRKCASR